MACASAPARTEIPTTPQPTLEAQWKAAADHRHEGFTAKPLFEVRAMASEVQPGFTQVEVTDDFLRSHGLEGQKLFLSDTPLIDSSLAQGAHLEIDNPIEDFDIESDLVLELNSDGRQRFEELTTVWKGKQVALMLEQRLISAPLIRETVRVPFLHLLLPPGHDLARLLREFNPPIDEAALTSLRTACAEGRIQSCMLLGREARMGRDLPYDSALAEEALATACRLGQAEGCFQAVYPLASVGRSGRVAVQRWG
ncbi:MAG: SecDF P1 head subdomain-containing protein, partial [Anaerolineae bacterium]